MADELLKQPNRPSSPYLVYTSAGNHAQVQRWLKGRKDFDLWITAYADNPSLKNLADYYNERKGGKFPNLHHAMQKWPDLFRKYQAIYVSDDDLSISGSAISELFQIRERYDLYILQPAFNQSGKLSHPITRAFLLSYLRYTNFVEVTCPLFRFDKLESFMEIYDPMLVCHGVDYWYIKYLVGDAREKAAVVDAIVAFNPPDSYKGAREISRLQSDEERLSNWEYIKTTRNLAKISPMITWSLIRRYHSLRVYSSTITALHGKIRNRLRHWYKERLPDVTTSSSSGFGGA